MDLRIWIEGGAPEQLQRYEKRCALPEKSAGRFSIPCAGSPVTTAIARTEPAGHFTTFAADERSAAAEPPSAKKSATTEMTSDGVTRTRTGRCMADLPGRRTPGTYRAVPTKREAPGQARALRSSVRQERLAPTAATAPAAATAVAIAARLLRRTRRGVLRPLDQRLRRDEPSVLVLGDELEADAPPCLVDLLHDDVEDVAALHHVLDVRDPTGPDVRDVEQAVGALLELDERTELGRLDDLAGVLVPDLRLLGEGLDRRNGGVALRALGGVDEDGAVLLDVDLDVVVALERADGLATLADDEADLRRVDLHRLDPRCVLCERGARLRDRLGHLREDEGACPLRLLERVPHDLLRDAGDLDVHLERGDPVLRAGHLEVHVTEVILGALDVGEDDVVVALLDEAHRDAGDRRLDRHAGVHERERRAADRAHRRRAVRLERLRDEADRVRELLRRRDHRLECPLRERPVADVTPLRAAHEARLPDRVRREVVVVHVAALVLEREIVDPLPLLGGAEGEERHDLRLPAGEEGRPVRARRDADLGVDLPDLVRGATVRATLVDRDLPADERLVDGLAGLLDELLRHRVLRGLALGRTDRERELDAVDDPLEEQRPLGGLQLLRVLLRIREGAEVVAELLLHRALDGGEPLLLQDQGEARAHLRPAEDVLLGRVHRQIRAELVLELLHDAAGLAQADLGDALGDPRALALGQLRGQLAVEPLRLARLPAQILLRLAELLDLAVRDLEGLEHEVLGKLVGAGLDHRERVARPDDDEVEARLALVHGGHGRVDDEGAVDPTDAHGADRAEERQRRDHQRRGGAVDREDVVRRDHVRAEHGADDLHLVAEALRPQRPDRAVDHAGGERRALGGAALALEEAAGDLARGVRALLDVDGQREEVRAFARFRPALRRREHHRVAGADDDGAVGLLGELARLEGDLTFANGHRDRRATVGGNRSHFLVLHSSLCMAESGVWARPAGRGRGSLKLHPPGVAYLAPEPELLDQRAV